MSGQKQHTHTHHQWPRSWSREREREREILEPINTNHAPLSWPGCESSLLTCSSVIPLHLHHALLCFHEPPLPPQAYKVSPCMVTNSVIISLGPKQSQVQSTSYHLVALVKFFPYGSCLISFLSKLLSKLSIAFFITYYFHPPLYDSCEPRILLEY